MDELKTQGQSPVISVVVPLLNEQDNLVELHLQLTTALGGGDSYEVIFVDDGSTDKSYEILTEFHRKDPQHIRVIRFRKNFGQAAAMSAGFTHARGEIIIPIDADLQNDPADIPSMVAKLNQGYDVVSGWRKKRCDNAFTRLLPSRIANWFISRITNVDIHDFGCTLKAYRREILAETRLYGEMHRFIPALASWAGADITEMVVNHRPRSAGVTKYGIGRTFKVVLDLMTVKFLGSFSTKPIYVFGGLGGFCGMAAFLGGLVLIFMKFVQGQSVNRNALFYLTVLMITTSVQFILMGLLAELLVRTHHESQNRPTYVIKNVLDDAPTREQT